MKSSLNITLSLLSIVSAVHVNQMRGNPLDLARGKGQQARNVWNMIWHSAKEQNLQDITTANDIYRALTMARASAVYQAAKRKDHCVAVDFGKELDRIVTKNLYSLSEDAKNALSENREWCIKTIVDYDKKMHSGNQDQETLIKAQLKDEVQKLVMKRSVRVSKCG